MNVPNHIAIILDGNGRWAKAKGLPRGYGHVKGCANLEQVCYDIKDLGVKYLTVYAFSTENWKRSREEVEALMKLFRSYLKKCIKISKKNNMKMKVIGDVTAFAPDIQQSVRELEEYSKDFDGIYFQLALNYGSRDEIRRGMQKMAQDVKDGKVEPDSITEEKLKVIKNHDITRISINPQSMQQKTLDVIGRKHTVEEIKEAYALARKTGFDNINMDIIAGLPGEDISDMEDTLAQIAQMHPDSLTVHSLAIKRAARMEMEDLNRDAKETHEILSGMIERAAKAAKEMDLFPYYLYRQKNIAGNFENVGYAKVDKAGIYNILIMEEKQSIIAAGAGASTKIVLKDPIPMPGSKKKKMTRLIRQENVKAVDAYIDRIDEMIERKGEWLWH